MCSLEARRRGRDSNPRGLQTLRVFETRALGQTMRPLHMSLKSAKHYLESSRHLEQIIMAVAKRKCLAPVLNKRVIGLEPTTYSLGSCRSTAELHPQNRFIIVVMVTRVNRAASDAFWSGELSPVLPTSCVSCGLHAHSNPQSLLPALALA